MDKYISQPCIKQPGVKTEINDNTPFNHQYYTVPRQNINGLNNKIMDSPVPPIGDTVDGNFPPLYFDINEMQKQDERQEKMLKAILAEFEDVKPKISFTETKLLRIYTTQQLMLITKFMQQQFGVVIKNYSDLQVAFSSRGGVIIYKKDLQEYQKEMGQVDDIIIELKDCEYVSILR